MKKLHFISLYYPHELLLGNDLYTFIEGCLNYNAIDEHYDTHDNKILETWKKWYIWKNHSKEQAEISIIDLIKKTAGNDDEYDFSYDKTLLEMINRLLDKSTFSIVDTLKGFNGSLRAYQKRGTSWLLYLESLGLNPCLADDMGLGKTIEIIAL